MASKKLIYVECDICGRHSGRFPTDIDVFMARDSAKKEGWHYTYVKLKKKKADVCYQCWPYITKSRRKLDEQQVKNIKKLLVEEFPVTRIASMYNVSHDIISKIKCGKHYK